MTRTLRATVALLATVLVSGPLVTACSTPGHARRVGPPATPDPVVALREAARALDRTTYHFEVTNELPPGVTTVPRYRAEYQGAVDPVAHEARVTWTLARTALVTGFEGRFDVIMIGNDRWASAQVAGVDSATWLHFPVAGMPATGIDEQAVNVTLARDMAALVDVAVSVKTDGRHRYRGTVDLTRDKHEIIDPDLVKKLGAAARSVPFEANVDDKGRLTYLKVMAPAPPGEPKENGEARRVYFTAIGRAVTFTAPVGAKEGSVSMYKAIFGTD